MDTNIRWHYVLQFLEQHLRGERGSTVRGECDRGVARAFEYTE
jgi:hypothetical protein